MILSGSASTKQAPWEEFQEINNELLCEWCEPTVELRRLEDLNKLDHGWLRSRDLINGGGDGQMMMQTFQTTQACSRMDDATN